MCPQCSAVSITTTVLASLKNVGTPTGTVTYREGTTILGTATVAAGQASLAISSLSPGIHIISTSYSGDTVFNPNTAPLYTQTVTSGTPAVSLSPSSLTFGVVTIGSVSNQQNVTLTNTGTATLTIGSITASGDFVQTNNCGSSVAP